MNMASFLKRSANLLVGASILKLVAGDLRSELRQDTAVLRSQTNAMIHRSPYRAAGTAAALGAVAGMLLVRRHRRGQSA